MLLPAYINVNQSGIPALRSLSVTVGTTDVRFDFNNHRNVGRPFRGLIIVNLAQLIPSGTTDTLPQYLLLVEVVSLKLQHLTEIPLPWRIFLEPEFIYSGMRVRQIHYSY